MQMRYLVPNDYMADPCVFEENGSYQVGWTPHHAVAEFKGKWYLFHHDSVPSGGKTWLRSLKVTELKYNPDGTIQTINGGG